MKPNIYIPILLILALTLALVVHCGCRKEQFLDTSVYNALYYNSGLSVRNETDKGYLQDAYPPEVLDTIATLNNTAKSYITESNRGNPYDLFDEALEKYSTLRRIKMVPDTQRNTVMDLPYGPAQYMRLDNVELYDINTKRIVRTSYVDLSVDPTTSPSEVTFNIALSFPLKKPTVPPNVFPANLFTTSGPLQLRNTWGLFEPYTTNVTENHLYKEDVEEYQKQVDKNTPLLRDMLYT